MPRMSGTESQRIRRAVRLSVGTLEIGSAKGGFDSMTGSQAVCCQATLRHPKETPYRCYLPVLAGFEGLRRAGPSNTRPIIASCPDLSNVVHCPCSLILGCCAHSSTGQST